MAQQPTCSGKQAVKAFERAGWTVHRQRSSHIIMNKPDERLSLSVPQHKEMKPGLLRGLIRDAGLGVDDFVRLLR